MTFQIKQDSFAIVKIYHDDGDTWKGFPHHWSFLVNPVTGDSPQKEKKWPVMRSFCVCFVSLNNLLNI